MFSIPISDFDYNLPDDRIAKYPLHSRDDSKFLVYKNNLISEDCFSSLEKYLPENSLLVFNDTRVIQARLKFRKTTGAEIEIFCLEPHEPADYFQAFQQQKSCIWKCLVGNSKKWKDGKINLDTETNCKLYAERITETNEWCLIKFSWPSSELTFGEILEQSGSTPIPPYLHRQSELIDKFRYQTIYSFQNGSVAAPTAGLHFTPAVFENLENKNIEYTGITLHVGAGTFKPVKESNAAQHEMHTEHFFIKKLVLEQLLKYSGNVTSVGTTSMRALESIYWCGAKLLLGIDNPFFINQWEVYNFVGSITPRQAIEKLINYCSDNEIDTIEASTQIMIVPGYEFKMVNRLITNFHQPKSTLLLLVAAFVGEKKWKEIYDFALNNGFRFLSYGDSSLLCP